MHDERWHLEFAQSWQEILQAILGHEVETLSEEENLRASIALVADDSAEIIDKLICQ